MKRFGRLAGRIAVAIPGIGLFVLVAHSPSIVNVVFFSLLSSLAAVEAVRLTGPGGAGLQVMAALLTGGAAAVVAMADPRVAVALVMIPGPLVSLMRILKNGAEGAGRSAAGLTGIMMLLSVSFGLVARLSVDYESPWIVFIPLSICWLNDTFAYFIGIAFGKHKMAPSISPAKSWEGFFAGLAGATAGAVLVGGLLVGFPLPPMVALGFVGGLAAVAGDLLESALKRDASVKDSGRILAGHGGVLDRFDSLLAVAPVVWLFMELGKEWIGCG